MFATPRAIRSGCGSRMMSTYAARSDVGLQRSHNEDRFCADPGLGLYLICDGMGGCNAGEVASGIAAEVIHRHLADTSRGDELPFVGEYDPNFLLPTNRLASAVRLANQVIYRESWRRPECAGMGTTVVSVLLTDCILSVAHVGDSRAYLIRDGAMQLLTADHSLVRDHVRRGLLSEEEAERSSRKHVLTRALGVESTVEVELGEVPVMSEDIVLLCSDGLTNGVASDEVLQAVRRGNPPDVAAERLIGLANDAGGNDNTTVIVVVLHEGLRFTLWRRIRQWLWS
ncbi:MAG TPA: Stp1/IreP family PP2C-type Ser/Thr phosphatase [Nitrospiraceae bacterium]|jgi:serine/threonine protein phosphatase PrpC|nr:Stp1/IreP family PP2C-type Ser/Thr phosphatase [Nitrospiraceae bacterium]